MIFFSSYRLPVGYFIRNGEDFEMLFICSTQYLTFYAKTDWKLESCMQDECAELCRDFLSDARNRIELLQERAGEYKSRAFLNRRRSF